MVSSDYVFEKNVKKLISMQAIRLLFHCQCSFKRRLVKIQHCPWTITVFLLQIIRPNVNLP